MTPYDIPPYVIWYNGFMIPNANRVIVKPIPINDLKSSGIVLPGNLVVGENLLFGKIFHPGDTKFVKGQYVFYSEYSAASILDAKSLLEGTLSMSKATEGGLVVVAQDDVMAYYDASEISTTTK